MPPEPLAAKKILIVDDEPFIAGLVRRLLRGAGYAAEDAADGAHALRQFAEGSWSLVITDRELPDMSGEELAAVIRQSDASVPIVLISGALGAIQRRELFAGVLAKPFTQAELLACVTRALEPRG